MLYSEHTEHCSAVSNTTGSWTGNSVHVLPTPFLHVLLHMLNVLHQTDVPYRVRSVTLMAHVWMLLTMRSSS